MKKLKKVINNYKTFLKYIISAGISFCVDILLFTFFYNLLKNITSLDIIIAATILARIISSFINYLLNKNLVFNVYGKPIERKTVFQYYLLVIIQMFLSGFLVSSIYNLIKINATIIKVVVDIVIFVVNYLIQKYIIFIKHGN